MINKLKSICKEIAESQNMDQIESDILAYKSGSNSVSVNRFNEHYYELQVIMPTWTAFLRYKIDSTETLAVVTGNGLEMAVRIKNRIEQL